MLGGAIAGSIPIAIHLLNKQRFKKVVWAAMHWLWASYKKSQRRLQVEQLILLLIRILLLVLLALALARPALQEGIGLISGRASVYRIIVLDNSYSMAQRAGGAPLFDKAKAAAVDLAEKLSLSDEADVLVSNSSGDDVIATSTTPRPEMVNQIKAAAISDGGSDIPRAIAAACRLINERKSKNRTEIIVITDQTRAGWERSDNLPRRVSTDDDAAIAKAFADVRTRPRILVARVSGDKDTENLAAVSIEVDEKVVPVGVDTQFIGTIASFASSEIKNVKVKLKVDGEETVTEVLPSISPKKPETVMFHHAFADAGSHSVAIEIESDVLPVDNIAYLALDVEEQMRVLCVDGQQRVGPNASELDYFRQALAPSKSEEIKSGKMPLFPEVISDSAFPEANLDNYRLVVLANVAIIPREKIVALEQFVKRGGALWIFTGDRVDPAIYNKDLSELLPMTLGELVGTGDADGPREKINEKDTGHPSIAKFSGIKGLSLSNLEVFRRNKLVPRVPADPAVRTVLSYENGEIAAAEKRMGEGNGRVMLFGTTADKAWNNWPGKNHYMPLMNFIALDLIQPAYIERNRAFGEEFVMHIPRQDLGEFRRQGLRLLDPLGEYTQLEIFNEQFLARSTPIRRAGVFTAQLPGDKKRTLHFAANRNIEESDLSTIEDREILMYIPKEGDTKGDRPGYFGTITQADLVLSGGEEMKNVEEQLKKAGGSREIWRWLAGTVLLLLLVESIFARRFGDFSR